jgi:hypothetical protein
MMMAEQELSAMSLSAEGGTWPRSGQSFDILA